MTLQAFSFGDPLLIGTEFEAERIFADDFFFWSIIRSRLISMGNLAGPSIIEINGNNDLIEFRFLTDDFTSNGYVVDQLGFLQSDLWDRLANNASIQSLSTEARNVVALLDAYATLGLPPLFEESSVARSAFRGQQGDDTYALRVDYPQFFADNAANPSTAGRLSDVLEPRISDTQLTVHIALATPAAGHPYLDYILAELYDLETNIEKLAIDDRYFADGSLQVDAASGLLANDVLQDFRVVEVDLVSVSSPSKGVVTVNPDGSFTYEPNPGETGLDSFIYRATANVETAPTAPNVAISAPATVVINLDPQPSTCPTDFDGSGGTDLADLLTVLANFGGSGPDGDSDSSGAVDLADLLAVLAEFGNACP